MELLRKRPKLSNVQMRVLTEVGSTMVGVTFGAREQAPCRVLEGHGYIEQIEGTWFLTEAGIDILEEVRAFQARRLDAAGRVE